MDPLLEGWGLKEIMDPLLEEWGVEKNHGPSAGGVRG